MGNHSSHALNWWDFGPCSQVFQTQVTAVKGHAELSLEGWQRMIWSWSTIAALYRILSVLNIERKTHLTQTELLWTLGLFSIEKKKGSELTSLQRKGNREGGVGLCSLITDGRMCGNGTKLHQERVRISGQIYFL